MCENGQDGQVGYVAILAMLATLPVTPSAPAKKPTGKKPGGQPGHPARMKVLVPAERVDEFVPHVPVRCAKCDEPLPQ